MKQLNRVGSPNGRNFMNTTVYDRLRKEKVIISLLYDILNIFTNNFVCIINNKMENKNQKYC